MACCLCFSLVCALVSCDDNGDGSGKTTTTVTKEEWEKMFYLTNANVNGTYEENGTETINIKISNNQCVVTVTEEDETNVSYMFYDYGKWFYGEEKNGEYFAEEASWISQGSSLELSDFIEGLDDYKNMYDDFTYDEAKKTYVYTTEEQTEDYVHDGYTDTRTEYSDTTVIYVEYGKLVKIEIIDGGYDYVKTYDDGTTEIINSSEGTESVYAFSEITAIESFPNFCINHSPSAEWSTDEGYHWHECLNEGCCASLDWSSHNWINNRTECQTCGYTVNN